MALDLSLSRGSEAYLDFVVGLKSFASRTANQHIQAQYKAAAEQWAGEHSGRTPETIEEVAALVEPTAPYQVNRLLVRKSQEMMWNGIIAAYAERTPALLVELNHPESHPLGSLTVDPAFQYPAYYQAHEYHLQPASYHGHDFSAVVYNMGQAVYHLRTNDKAANQRAVVRAFPPPPTPEPSEVRILDMGCGFGTTTWPFCEAFPQAQVYGIDVAAPLLKLAHKRAQELQMSVHFSQQAAEQTNFPSESFDLILAHALLHELPKESVRRVIAEAYRLLKPGGTFIDSDVVPYKELTPFARFLSDWQVEHNGEPFWRSTLSELDVPAIFAQTGFTEVSEYGLNTSRIAPKFPWLVIGRKKGN